MSKRSESTNDFSSEEEDNGSSRISTCSTSMSVSSGGSQVSNVSDLFGSIGKINFENCKDSHIGPNIVADTCHINVNGGEPVFFAKLQHQLEGLDYPYIDSVPKYKKTFKLKVGKYFLTFAIGMIIAMLITTVAGLVMMGVLVKDRSAKPTLAPHTKPTITTMQPSSTHKIITTATTPKPFWTSTSVTNHTTTTRKPSNKFVRRFEWGGRNPPRDASRNRTQVQSVIIDNTAGAHCSTVSNCSKVLQHLENANNSSLDYNFMVDDAGNIYEARGWYFAADQLLHSADLIKFGFIGEFQDKHLNEIQVSSFQSFMNNHGDDFFTPPLVKAQCCRDIDGQTGPDKNLACDLSTVRGIFMDVQCLNDIKACDKRKFWQYFTNPFDCDD